MYGRHIQLACWMGTSTGQVCQARLPGTSARHVCQARLPGTSARHVCQARLPGTSARACLLGTSVKSNMYFGLNITFLSSVSQKLPVILFNFVYICLHLNFRKPDGTHIRFVEHNVTERRCDQKSF
jgi:hypothetical protein